MSMMGEWGDSTCFDVIIIIMLPPNSALHHALNYVWGEYCNWDYTIHLMVLNNLYQIKPGAPLCQYQAIIL